MIKVFEFHGCKIAGTKRINGKTIQRGEWFLMKLAMELGMPVSGGKGGQNGDTTRQMFRYEGALSTWCPKLVRQSWTRQAAYQQQKIDGTNRMIKVISDAFNK